MEKKEKYLKENRNDDSRALLEKELEAFLGEVENKPLDTFVELVKNYKELELCFRGNSKDKPRISIYSNNNIIFSVLTSGRIEISFNHARYCDEWGAYYNMLKDYRFKGEKGKTKTGDITVGAMTRSLKDNPPLDYEQVEDIYENVLKPIFDKYFEVEGQEDVIDYFKHKKRVKVSGKTEKRRQQELFTIFNNVKNGYFFYDLELSQRHKNKEEAEQDSNNNKPDMQAIRFNGEGVPDKIVFVEVKSTEYALGGTSGIIEHIKKMKAYDSNSLICRRKEACDIMNQYAQLELRGLSKNNAFKYEDFCDLDLEILLVFTDKAIDPWEKDERFKMAREKTEKIEYNNKSIPFDIRLYTY